MPKLASSESAQLKKPPAPSSGSSPRIHNLRVCSTARTPPSLLAKRRASPEAPVPLKAKRSRSRRILHDSATEAEEESWIQICCSARWLKSGDSLLLYCASQIPPVWGAKRARSAFSGTHPIRGPHGARSAVLVLPVQPNWADLEDGPAGLIAARLLASDVADYVSFRSVCRPWRLCSTDPRKHSILDRRFHPHHWIMLWESGGAPYRRRFMNVSSGHCRYMDLPELLGHDIFPTTEGLLVLLHRTSYVVRLLNPFTRQSTDLPPATTLLSQNEMRLTNITRNLLQVTGAGLADEFTIAVHFRGIRTLAVIKPGDAHWMVVDRGSWLRPALSFSGRFYCATTDAVMVVETSADHPPRLAMVVNLIRPLSRIIMDTVHLMDIKGELMLVDRQHMGNDTRSSSDSRKYNVYRVDLDARKMVPVRGIGGRAAFIGIDLALSVSPSLFPSISADTIYLGFDQRLIGRLDNSPIHLMDGTAEPRQFDKCKYGPRGIDDYLAWFVTGYSES